MTEAGAAPLPGLVRAASRLHVPAGVVEPALALLAEAGSREDVAAACLPVLGDLPGVRAAAVVSRHGREVVVLGSTGYDCGVMAPGATLPLDAGLPVTEAVRTGRPVAQGAGPGWQALPFGRAGRGGALLLSLDVSPAADRESVDRLLRIAATLGRALERAAGHDGDAGDLAVVTAALRPRDLVTTRWHVASRQLTGEGDVGGDLVTCLDDDADGTWFVVADVCGAGLPAALVAGAVRTAVHAAAPLVNGPSALLAAVERAVRPVVGADCFVTATAVHARPDRLRVASAGHPLPLLLAHGVPVPLACEPGPPLALDGQAPQACAEAAVDLPGAAALLLHTDGLTDRRTADGIRMLDPRVLVAGVDLSSLGTAADAVLARADEVAPPSDDVSLLLVRARDGLLRC